MTSTEKNPYLGYGSRRVILLGLLCLALTDPAHCTPTGLYLLLTDPKRLLKLCRSMQTFKTLVPNDPVLAVIKVEALNLLDRAAKNEENFASFLEGASQKLIAFNSSGHLGDYGSGAIHNIAAIRERPIVVFIMAPLSHVREFGDFTSLVDHNVIAACEAKPGGHPVHIVGEEALDYCFVDLPSDIETLRQLRVTGDFYVQSFAGLERHYGREAAAAIEAYADIRIYAGLNAYDRAKRVSDMLPDPNSKGLVVDLHGDLAGILNVATKPGRAKPAQELDLKQIRMVVGMDFAVATETQGKVVGPAGLEPATRPL